MLKILLSVAKADNYVKVVESCGAMAIAKQNPDDNVDYDGLILCGGNDVDPLYYGEKMNGSEKLERERDACEIALTKKFLETGKPILGICRGMQLLNVVLGGTLIQHVESVNTHRDIDKEKDLIHEVIANKGSIFENLYGQKFNVNSFHHQAVKTLGYGLTATLFSTDKTIVEGYEHKNKPYYGVQWHPERLSLSFARNDAVDGRKIIKFFIDKCEEYKNR